MRRIVGVTSVLLVLNLAFAISPQAAQQAMRVAQKPLYAKVALNPDQSRVLALAYAESKGLGTGYDVLYADVNFNGRFDGAEKRAATIRRCSMGIHCDFPAIKLNVPYGKNAAGSWYPCELTFYYQKHTYRTRSRLVPTTARQSRIRRVPSAESSGTTTREDFQVQTTVELRQGTTRWQYSFRGNLKPSRTLQTASQWDFLGTPKVTITTRPDGQKKGNTGIGLTLGAGENRFECKRGGLPLKAHLEIKGRDGRVVHRDEATLDKFTFG